jgi:MSHA biogenesis protein MshI
LCESFREEGSPAATLARLRKELRLDNYQCTTLLRFADYQLHALDAPSVPGAELKNAVRWRVKDVIDYPVDSATVDVLEVPAAPGGTARGRNIYAVTARNDVIGRLVQPFNESRVPLDVIDIPTLSQRNIAALFEQQGRGIAMLAFYEECGELTFTGGGELYLTRRIDVPLAQLLEADEPGRKSLFERIALELQRSLDHFDRQYSYLPVVKLALSPLPKDIGLQEYLASTIYVPVETIDLATVMDFPDVPELKHPARQAQCLATIGAALRDEAAAP